MSEFEGFQKIARLSRDCVITEKIDGTNAQIFIADDFQTIKFGSRTRWITPENDNFGFAKWGESNKEELLKLGPGRHFGEWWGSGIQRGYGLRNGEKRFSLFAVHLWNADNKPKCCEVVPTLYRGIFDTQKIEECLSELANSGSKAAPGFMQPEGIIIYHEAAKTLFKKTVEKDYEPKGAQ
ncbi:MAG TPA: RNA ligase family protein [Anaerolineales bacterium]|nr:RNA ligase family protein [Anaerolineales bacterium]